MGVLTDLAPSVVAAKAASATAPKPATSNAVVRSTSTPAAAKSTSTPAKQSSPATSSKLTSSVSSSMGSNSGSSNKSAAASVASAANKGLASSSGSGKSNAVARSTTSPMSSSGSSSSSAAKQLGAAAKVASALGTAASSGGGIAAAPRGTRQQEDAMDSLSGLDVLLPEILAKSNALRTPVGPGADYADLTDFFRGAKSDDVGAAATSQPLNAWDQFWADQNAYRQGQIDRRAAAGVTPSEGIIDWNGIRYDLNQPYRDRIMRENEARTAFDPLQVVKDEHEKRLAQVAARTNIPGWVAQARADQAAGKPAVAAPDVTTLGANAFDRLSDYQPLLDLMGGTQIDKIYDPNAKVRSLPDVGALPTEAAFAADTRMPPLPRARPDYQDGEGGIDMIQVGDPTTDGGITKVTAKLEEPSVWDKVVEGGGKVLEHTTLGGVVKTLFPDIWEAGGQIMKGKGGGLRGTPSPDDQPSWFDQITDPFYSAPQNEDRYSLLHASSNRRAHDPDGTPVPPVTPSTPIPPPNTGGGGATAPVYDRWGNVVFPNMPPYNPGVDPEWLYFRQKLADGGIVGYADGGPIAPPADPRMSIIADAEDAIEGDSPDPQGALDKFVKTFGQEALTSLIEQVRAGMKMRQRGRMVRGPGGPKDDAVPAMTDAGQPVALSNGEFVMPAQAVDGAGGPEQMQQLSDELQARGS